jgi:hypothetical protein
MSRIAALSYRIRNDPAGGYRNHRSKQLLELLRVAGRLAVVELNAAQAQRSGINPASWLTRLVTICPHKLDATYSQLA